MSIGLLVGMYAFDGPLPAPAFVGDYLDFPRRLSRLGHAYGIVFGLLAILVARKSANRRVASLLAAGTVLTLLAIFLLGFAHLTTLILAPGPVLIAAAMMASLWPSCRRTAGA